MKIRAIINKITTIILAAVIISTVAPKNVEAAQRYGIDVSYHQGNIDWAQVKNSGMVQFAYIRGGSFNSGIDACFYKNMDGAIANGIPVGIYVYSYASNAAEAAQEGLFAVSCARSYPVSLPLVFDIEGNTIKNASAETLRGMIDSFCSVVEAAGYTPMVYSSKNNFTDRIGNISRDKWVAQYATACAYPNPDFWQYTSKGSIPGIAGNVDCDVQYKDYSGIINANGWRTVGGNTFYIENYIPHKGWLDAGGKRYYMDPLLGTKMTGLVTDGLGVYYCGSDGSMQTGLINIAGANFYFDPATGAMLTNQVVKVGKKTYSLDVIGVATEVVQAKKK